MIPHLELAARLLELRNRSDRRPRHIEHLPLPSLFANEARFDDLGLNLGSPKRTCRGASVAVDPSPAPAAFRPWEVAGPISAADSHRS